MEKVLRLEKKRPVLRMLIRFIEHSKSYEEIEELWLIQHKLLSVDERVSWYIYVFTEYKWSLPHER